MRNDNEMPALVREHRQLVEQNIDIKRRLADVEREMLAIGTPKRRATRKQTARAIKETHHPQAGVIMLPQWHHPKGASLENYLNVKLEEGWYLVSACLAEANQRIILIFRR